MPKLILLVGPPGSGKSTYYKKLSNKYFIDGIELEYVNQDIQGKNHLRLFEQYIKWNHSIVIDRMNFNKEQRERYTRPAKIAGYEIEIIIFHETFETCLKRCIERKDHPTIKDEATARKALHGFFSKYERVEDIEADKVTRLWPEGSKPSAIVVDLDGTLCNIDHRLHFLQQDKPNWKLFFESMINDKVNDWCYDLVKGYSKYTGNHTVLCSGRPDDFRRLTEDWLDRVTSNLYYDHLFMRQRGDHRSDDVIKQILYDFEIKTRFNVSFVLDDRPSVCRMWRLNNIICLQCNDKEF